MSNITITPGRGAAKYQIAVFGGLITVLLCSGCASPPTVPRHELERVGWQVRTRLEDQSLPFWTSRRLLKDAYRGFLPVLDESLEPTGDTTRNMVVYLRGVYGFAVGVNHGRLGLERKRMSDELDRRLAYLASNYWDSEAGGFLWELNSAGIPAGLHKGTLGQVYAIYVLAETYRLTQRAEALDLARRTFAVVDATGHDTSHGGYLANYERSPESDENRVKSGGLQMHMMLALATLYGVDPKPVYRERLEELLKILTDRFEIPNSGGNAYYALERDWSVIPADDSLNTTTCYAHNAELVWYAYEAVRVLGRDAADFLPWMSRLTEAILENGVSKDGAVFFTGPYRGRATNQTVYWWAQSEAMIVLLRMYELTGQIRYWNNFHRVWDWTQRYMIIDDSGAWVAFVDGDGKRLSEFRTGGNWKAGLHAIRALSMCDVMLQRLLNTR